MARGRTRRGGRGPPHEYVVRSRAGGAGARRSPHHPTGTPTRRTRARAPGDGARTPSGGPRVRAVGAGTPGARGVRFAGRSAPGAGRAPGRHEAGPAGRPPGPGGWATVGTAARPGAGGFGLCAGGRLRGLVAPVAQLRGPGAGSGSGTGSGPGGFGTGSGVGTGPGAGCGGGAGTGPGPGAGGSGAGGSGTGAGSGMGGTGSGRGSVMASPCGTASLPVEGLARRVPRQTATMPAGQARRPGAGGHAGPSRGAGRAVSGRRARRGGCGRCLCRGRARRRRSRAPRSGWPRRRGRRAARAHVPRRRRPGRS